MAGISNESTIGDGINNMAYATVTLLHDGEEKVIRILAEDLPDAVYKARWQYRYNNIISDDVDLDVIAVEWGQ